MTTGRAPVSKSALNVCVGLGSLLVVGLIYALWMRQEGLASAAQKGDTAMTRVWLLAGANPSRPDRSGRSALFQAARFGRTPVVELLLARGVDVDTVQPWVKTTPLMAAADAGRTDIVQLLLSHGARLGARDHTGRTPLMHAAWAGHVDTEQALLKHGANLEVTDAQSLTALGLAAWQGHTAAVTLLLEHGADVEARDMWGGTPLRNAAGGGYVGTVQALLDHGADVDERMEDTGWTVLMEAAENGRTAIVKLLLDNGANVNAKSPRGETALSNVKHRTAEPSKAQRDYEQIARLLRQAGAEEAGPGVFSPKRLPSARARAFTHPP